MVINAKGRDLMFPVINKRATGINLRKIMDQRGITVKDVQKYLGLGSVQSVYHWLNGISMPTIDNLYALSELFNLSIDALVRGNRESAIMPDVALEISAPYYKRMHSYYEKLNEKHVA